VSIGIFWAELNDGKSKFQFSWEKSLNGNVRASQRDMWQNSDGNMFSAVDAENKCIVSFDLEGNLRWEKYLSGYYGEACYGIDDTAVYIIANEKTYNFEPNTIIVAAYDLNGQFIKNFTKTLSNRSVIEKIWIDDTPEVYITGRIYDPNSDLFSLYFLKLSSDLEFIGEKNFTSEWNAYPMNMNGYKDHIYISGYYEYISPYYGADTSSMKDSGGDYYGKGFFIILSNDGELIRMQEYNLEHIRDQLYFNSHDIASDGDIFVCGTQRTGYFEINQLVLYKLNPNLEIEWSVYYENYPSDCEGKDILIDKEGNMLILAEISSIVYGTKDIAIFKYSNQGGFLELSQSIRRFDQRPLNFLLWKDSAIFITGSAVFPQNEWRFTLTKFSFDTDGDGLSDEFELNELGTDPEKVDSDGDLISDYLETLLLTNPLSKFSNLYWWFVIFGILLAIFIFKKRTQEEAIKKETVIETYAILHYLGYILETLGFMLIFIATAALSLLCFFGVSLIMLGICYTICIKEKYELLSNENYWMYAVILTIGVFLGAIFSNSL
jgi:hypothetical protein